ncbi:MAG: molecular chaperone DnaJ [Candidatus Neomarinimicrobiota bacterium]
MKDLYEILGLNKNATKDEIKKSYRKVAMKYHPDRNPGDKKAEANFKAAAEAYSILNDRSKRDRYDQFGHAGVGLGDNPRGSNYQGHMSMEDIFQNFGDLFGGMDNFESFFGGSSGRRQARQGTDLKISLKLEYIDILKGTQKTIKIKRLENCKTCSGSGARAGTGFSSCRQCGGSGKIRQMSQSFFGQQVVVRECPICSGSGQIIENPCKTCGGNGLERKLVEIKVKVPAGVATGNYMTLESQGNKGPGNIPAGDLIVFFEEVENPTFSRYGNDVFLEAFISFYQAALGTTLEIPTIDGQAKLKIPAGIQAGQMLRMRGKGFPKLRGSTRGDQMVRVQVETPRKLDRNQRRLLEELAQLNGQEKPVFKRLDLNS